jgi:hypothetical protein
MLCKMESLTFDSSKHNGMQSPNTKSKDTLYDFKFSWLLGYGGV